MPMIGARNIVGDALVPGSSNERVGLTRRPADQDDQIIRRLPDIVDHRIEDRFGAGTSELQLQRLAVCGRPFERMSGDKPVESNLAFSVFIVVIWKVLELARKIAKPQGLECRGVLFDGKRNIKDATAPA